MDPITTAIAVSVAGSLASTAIGWLLSHLSHKAKDAHVQQVIAQVGAISQSAVTTGVAAGVQAASSGASIKDVAKAAGAAAGTSAVQAGLQYAAPALPAGPAPSAGG